MNGPPSHVRDRILAATAARPAATRETHRQRRLALVLLMLAFVVGSSTMLAGRHPDAPQRPMAYLITMLAASVIVAIMTAYYMLGPTASALGRSSRFYRILTFVTPCILALAALVANLLAPATMMASADDAPHLACSTITFIAGAAVLAILLLLERRSATTSVTLKGASYGAVGAAWATLFISISCPYAHPLHVVPTHILAPIVPLVIGGMVAGARILALRANRSSS